MILVQEIPKTFHISHYKFVHLTIVPSEIPKSHFSTISRLADLQMQLDKFQGRIPGWQGGDPLPPIRWLTKNETLGR